MEFVVSGKTWRLSCFCWERRTQGKWNQSKPTYSQAMQSVGKWLEKMAKSWNGTKLQSIYLIASSWDQPQNMLTGWLPNQRLLGINHKLQILYLLHTNVIAGSIFHFNPKMFNCIYINWSSLVQVQRYL